MSLDIEKLKVVDLKKVIVDMSKCARDHDIVHFGKKTKEELIETIRANLFRFDLTSSDTVNIVVSLASNDHVYISSVNQVDSVLRNIYNLDRTMTHKIKEYRQILLYVLEYIGSFKDTDLTKIVLNMCALYRKYMNRTTSLLGGYICMNNMCQSLQSPIMDDVVNYLEQTRTCDKMYKSQMYLLHSILAWAALYGVEITFSSPTPSRVSDKEMYKTAILETYNYI